MSAVVLYFRKTIYTLLIDWLQSLRQRSLVGESILAWAVILGTIPVGLAGLFLGDLIENHLRSPLVLL